MRQDEAIHSVVRCSAAFAGLLVESCVLFDTQSLHLALLGY